MALPPVVTLEIGTTKTVALVAEMRDDGHVMITGLGEHPSVGVRKGEIIDFENAASCVRSAVEMAEESGKVAVRQVHLAVSGGHIEAVTNRGSVPVLDEEGEITEDDVEQVMEVARAINLPVDREQLHTICQHFQIDDQQRVIRPEGMEGAKLSLDMLILHGVRSRLHNTIRVVRSIPLDVHDVVFSGIGSALAVLTVEQKRSGIVVIDLGGGTTDYLVYADNVVAAAGSLGLGGDHVTNDIALAFNIPTAQSEGLKKEAGSAVTDGGAGAQRVTLPPQVGFQGRTVALASLHTVINARMDEILRMVRKRLEERRVLSRVGAGIVLTGGGSRLKGLGELAEKVFRLPCAVGPPRSVSGLDAVSEGPEYATCAGLAQYAFRTLGEEAPTSLLGRLVRGFFGR